MRFSEAIEAMMSGKKIKIVNTNNSVSTAYRYIKGDDFIIEENLRYIYYTSDNVFSLRHLLSPDWEIVEEEPKLHAFGEVVKALEKGKIAKRKDSHTWIKVQVEEDSSFALTIVEYIRTYLGNDDINAKDWIIRDVEEGEKPSLKS